MYGFYFSNTKNSRDAYFLKFITSLKPNNFYEINDIYTLNINRFRL